MKLLPLVVALVAAGSTAVAERIVCYYTNWSRYGNEPFQIEQIDTSLCTHVVYAFLGLDENGVVKSVDSWNDFGDTWSEGGLSRFGKLKNRNPSVKLLLGIGGWNQGATYFQRMVRSPEKRKAFLDTSIDYIRRYNLDGLEIDWVYQNYWDVIEGDKAGYATLLGEMMPVYQQKGYVLSIAASGNPQIIDTAYDIPTVSKNVDYINVMTYDFHGSWDGKTGHVAPLYPMKSENGNERLNNVEAAINKYIEKGAPSQKLNTGVVAYGRTFTLVNPANKGMNAPTRGAGKEEPLPYRKFCVQDKSKMWEKFRNDEQRVPYAVKGDEWVGNEDEQSLREKVKFGKSKKLGGVSFWSLDMDDFKGNCGSGTYPLLRACKDEMNKK